MKLSRNFSLSELIKSDTAIRLGIDNNPNADQIEKLKNEIKQRIKNLKNDKLFFWRKVQINKHKSKIVLFEL